MSVEGGRGLRGLNFQGIYVCFGKKASFCSEIQMERIVPRIISTFAHNKSFTYLDIRNIVSEHCQ